MLRILGASKSGQIIATTHDLRPQKVAFWKGNGTPFQGKSRLVKYYSIWPDPNLSWKPRFFLLTKFFSQERPTRSTAGGSFRTLHPKTSDATIGATDGTTATTTWITCGVTIDPEVSQKLRHSAFMRCSEWHFLKKKISPPSD